MEKYHIYEEIGKGNFSQVFKGREKKKIEYVAIKRIEKSEMSKIVAEVQVMHKLSHPHILRFYDWYETRHNLWLILEYCTGGDLESILKQDGHLPETSIRIFGLDMVAGMKYLHSLGFIHCDLRPRNFLIDEYGILKISDFKRTIKIPTQELGQKPIAERGTASYMSPELFTAEGCYSFQSDFWALGCALYELRRGFLPFGDYEERLEVVMSNIRELDPISTPIIPASLITPGKSSRQVASSITTISNPLADLLRGLLEKSLMFRCNWEQISLHPFWRPANPAPPQQLPPQPVLDNLLREMDRVRSDSLQKQIYTEMGVYNADSIADIAGSRENSSQNRPSSPSNKSVVAVSSNGTPVGSAVKGLRRQWDENDAPPPPSSQAKSTSNTVVSSVASRSVSADAKGGSEMRGNISNTKRRLFDDEPSPRNQTPQPLDNNQLPLPNPEFLSNNSNTSNTAAVSNQSNKAADRHSKATTVMDTPFNSNLNQGLSNRGTTATAVATTTAVTSGVQSQAAIGRGIDNVSSDLLWDLVPESILSHGTDSQVKPIVGNRAIEDTEDPEFNEKNVTFTVYKLDRIAQMSQEELEGHLTQLYKLLYKSATSAQSAVANATVVGALTERVSLLSYLSVIAACAEVANIVLNTHFLSLLLKLLKTTTNYQATQPLRNQSPSQNASNAATSLAQQSRYLCAHNLAMMLRFATYIQAPAIRSREDHIVGTLIQVLKDTQGSTSSTRAMSMDARMRRKAAAALGEMIFYISAQDEEAPSTNNHGNEAATTDKWTLAPSTVEFVIKSLKDESDEIIKHYMAKTIENVQAQGGFSYRKRFVSYDLCLTLLELAQNSHRNESLQSTCAMALYHILYFALHFHQDPLSIVHGREGVSSAGKSGSAGSASSSRRPTSQQQQQPSTATIDPFAAPSVVNSTRFLVKILDKANLGGMVEIFQDGTPKLQQAFLNIVLLVFTSPLGSYSGSSITSANTMDANVVSAVQNELESLLQELQQQVVFSSLNMVVSVPEPPMSKLDVTQLGTIQSLLSPLRSYFLRAQTVLLPALFRLMDQGGATPLRAKAMLLVQCLCSHSPTILIQLPERKFSSALVRILEPYLSALEGQYQQQQQLYLDAQGHGQPQNNNNLLVNNNKKLSSPTYLMKAAMSMFVFLRKVFVHHIAVLAFYIEEITQTNLMANGNHANSTFGTEEEDLHVGSRRGSLSPTSPNKNKSKNATAATSAAAGASSRLSFSSTQFVQVAKLLRALVALFASPSLVRLFLPNTVEWIRWLGRVLQALPAARAQLVALPRTNTNDQSAMIEALDNAEQTALLCLEFVAQVDIPSYYLGCITTPSSTGIAATSNSSSPTVLLQQKLSQWSVLITTTLQRLIPAASRLLSHPEVDIRIMITGTFRRLLPSYLRAFFMGQHPDVHLYDQQQVQHKRPITKSILTTLQTMVSTMLSTFLLSAPSLLTDVAPIPPYTLRIYNDIFSIHPLLTREIITTVWKQGNIIPIFIQMLQVQSTSSSTNTTNNNAVQDAADNVSSQPVSTTAATNNGLDPLLIMVVRQLWDVGHGQETLLLQHDLAGALTVAIIATVYAQISYPFVQEKSSVYHRNPEVGHDDDESNDDNDDEAVHRNKEINFEVILPLLDLLYTILHYVLKISAQQQQSQQPSSAGSPSSGSRPSSSTSATPAAVTASETIQQFRRFVTSLRATSPALLLLIAYTEYHLQQPVGERSAGTGYPTRPSTAATANSNTVGNVFHLVLDLSTKSLGMLFDLFPETVASQLLSRQSVLLDQQQQQHGSSSSRKMLPTAGFIEPDALAPRLILTSAVYNSQVDLRVIVKILKIFYGTSKVAVNLGHVSKVKEWILQEPVYPALQFASRWTRLTPYLAPHPETHHQNHQAPTPQQPSALDMQHSIQRLATQLIDMAMSL